MMDSIQKVDYYGKIPSSQTFRSYERQCPVYGKSKVALCMLKHNTMKMYGGRKGIDQCILNLGTSCFL
jgi:hypothetical protein